MEPIEAVYEKGVFRPVKPVVFPEGARVTFRPRRVPTDAELDRMYELLSQTFDSGDQRLTERHDEHQP